MYISQIYASGFRCFAPDAPLELALSRGLNILVGPNDAGKSAIIDAARYVLWTRGDDYIRPDIQDFHVDAAGRRAEDFIVRCTFDGLSPEEEARFLEWCTNEKGRLRLHVCMRGSRRASAGGGSVIAAQHRSGADGEGLPLDGELREYLKATYLKPLRDAEREMRPGRRSRLSRILGAMPAMGRQGQSGAPWGGRTLKDTLDEADDQVRRNTAVTGVATSVNTDFLGKLSFADDPLVATLDLGVSGSFDQILERFELYLNAKNGGERVQRGLGYNNLLFMAAELLLLQSHPDQVPFLLIEEPEAHLHPQHQTLFMEMLVERASEPAEDADHQQVQVLLTTHSPQLAAAADLETLTIIVGHKAFPLGKDKTRLQAGDYEFLRRFLDATKANLFFARGLILVEGDGEALLLPAIAERIGKPLGRHGVSIINVGHRGLFRYSRILQRADGGSIGIPVALVPDRDIPPREAKPLVGTTRTEDQWEAHEIEARMKTLRRDTGDPVEAFIADCWTLEFDLALRPGIAKDMHIAVQLAKTASRDAARLEAIRTAAAAEYNGWIAASLSARQIAVEIYRPVIDKRASKAVVAEQFAARLRKRTETAAELRALLPPYLVAAIDYAAGGYAGAAKAPFADEADGEEDRDGENATGSGDAPAPSAN